MEEEKERALSEKDRVSVRLRDPAAIERQREARKAKRAEKSKARGTAAAADAAADDSDSDDSEGEESSEPINASDCAAAVVLLVGVLLDATGGQGCAGGWWSMYRRVGTDCASGRAVKRAVS